MDEAEGINRSFGSPATTPGRNGTVAMDHRVGMKIEIPFDFTRPLRRASPVIRRFYAKGGVSKEAFSLEDSSHPWIRGDAILASGL